MDRAPRPDLGALLHRLTLVVVERELPLLRDHEIEMWDYVVLNALEHGAAPTQTQLARTSGRDKTRLITSLDRLEARGLVLREPDPDDRRNRIVTLTKSGRALLIRCRRDIRAMEKELLGALDAPHRNALIDALVTLHDATRDDD